MIKNICLLMIVFGSITSLKLEDASINGTWVCEDDSNWTMVFDDSDCKWYYNGELQDHYSYHINSLSPQCGRDVLVDSKTKYLSIKNRKDTSDTICYEIHGLSESTLTLRLIDKGGFLIFHRK